MRVRAKPVDFPARATLPAVPPRAAEPSRNPFAAVVARYRRWHERSARRRAATWERLTVEMSDAELATLARRSPPSPEDVRWRLMRSAGGGCRL